MARLAALAPVALALVALALAAPAAASPYLQAGIQDDAWLRYGPGTLEERIGTLDRLGVDVVRYTLDWRELEPRRGGYDWSSADAVLRGLHARGIAPLVTLWGTPAWANGGRAPNWAPSSERRSPPSRAPPRSAIPSSSLARLERAEQAAVPRPTSAQVYVERLLNPAYTAIHAVDRGAQVGGGVTGPIAGARRRSRRSRSSAAMQRYHARLDAYAHNPYPAEPAAETPFTGGCARCATITMATLDKLLKLVRRIGSKRIWLTEYAYQTNPPDRTSASRARCRRAISARPRSARTSRRGSTC